MTDTAHKLGFTLYLVGGPVRDLLLGHPTPDLDFAVEGHAVVLALALAEQGWSLEALHDDFGTATLRHAGRRIDLATARREFYPRPGDLPRVRPATILDDLKRRDFTVHAMAISPASPPLLLDPTGGLRDLRARVLRVLHPWSFHEDPTRLFRLVRYAVRLNFEPSPETRDAMRCAISARAPRLLTPERLHHELTRALQEPNPDAVLEGYLREGLLSALHRRWTTPPDLFAARPLARLREQFPGVSLYEPALLLLVHPFPPAQAERLLRRVGARKSVLQLTPFLAERPSLRSALLRQSGPGDQAILLDRFPVAFLHYLWCAEPDLRAALTRYLRRSRNFRLRITGEQLLQAGLPPGPRLGEILRELRRLRLNGEISAAEELETALRLARHDLPS